MLASVWKVSIYLGKGHNISLTWIVRPFGDDFPQTNHYSRLRENRVRSWSNLPRYIYIIQTPISWVCLRLGSTPNVGKYTTHGAIMEYHLDQRLTITDALAALALLIRSRGARHDLRLNGGETNQKTDIFQHGRQGFNDARCGFSHVECCFCQI